MAFVAPAPGAGLGGLAEEGEEVEVWIAGRPAALLDFSQDVLKLSDRFGLGVALLAEAGAQQSQRCLSLRGV